MPAIANLVLTDRAATPVNHTFTPREAASGKGVLVSNTGVSVGEKRVTLATTRSASGKTKITTRLIFPVVATETINGVAMPKVVRSSYANIEFVFDPTSTEQERKDTVGFTESVIQAGKWTNEVYVKGEVVY